MHFPTLIIAAIATRAPFAFAEEQKYGEHSFSRTGKATGAIRPFPIPSGKPHFTVPHHVPTFKPSGYLKHSGPPKPSGLPKPSSISISVEDTQTGALEKPKASGKPFFAAPSGKPLPTHSNDSIKAHPSGKPALKPITHLPIASASGKPKPKPKPKPSPLISPASVVPVPEETNTETAEKLKRFDINARQVDDFESPPIIADSISTNSTPAHTKCLPSSVKSAHAAHTGKPHCIKTSPGHAHATGGFAHPSAHHVYGVPSGFVTSKKTKTRTVSVTASEKKGKPTPKAE